MRIESANSSLRPHGISVSRSTAHILDAGKPASLVSSYNSARTDLHSGPAQITGSQFLPSIFQIYRGPMPLGWGHHPGSAPDIQVTSTPWSLGLGPYGPKIGEAPQSLRGITQAPRNSTVGSRLFAPTFTDSMTDSGGRAKHMSPTGPGIRR